MKTNWSLKRTFILIYKGFFLLSIDFFNFKQYNKDK